MPFSRVADLVQDQVCHLHLIRNDVVQHLALAEKGHEVELHERAGSGTTLVCFVKQDAPAPLVAQPLPVGLQEQSASLGVCQVQQCGHTDSFAGQEERPSASKAPRAANASLAKGTPRQGVAGRHLPLFLCSS